MADALLDKSLDALIAERGQKKPTGVRVRSGAGGKPLRGRGGKPAGPSGGDAKPKQQQKRQPAKRAPLTVQSKKIAKPSRPAAGRSSAPRGGRVPAMPALPRGLMMPPIPPGWALVPQAAVAGGPMLMPFPGAMQAGRAAAARPTSSTFRRRDPDADQVWVHDMGPQAAFQGRSRPTPLRRQEQPRPVQPPVANGTRLIVRNLAEKVTEQDIEELFSTKGPLLEHFLHNDGSGEATVVFEEKADALQAIEEYNKLMLDGLKLDISLAPEQQLMKLSSGLKVTQEPAGGSVRPSRGPPGAGRMLLQAMDPGPAQQRAPMTLTQSRAHAPSIPRGMGDPGPSSYQGQGKGRGFGPGPTRIRSGVSRAAAVDDMQE